MHRTIINDIVHCNFKLTNQNEGCRLEVFGLTTFITEASEDSLASLIGLVLSSKVGRNIGLVRTGSSFDSHSGLVSLLDCGAHIDTAMWSKLRRPSAISQATLRLSTEDKSAANW